jgi:hypothetical protein
MKRAFVTAVAVVIVASLAQFHPSKWIPLPEHSSPRIVAPAAKAFLEPLVEETPNLAEDFAGQETAVSEERHTQPTRSSALEMLIGLAAIQNADGSWGDGPALLGDLEIGPAGMTGLALVSFLNQGYSHLSKDAYDGFRFGEVIKRGLLWLIDRQLADGTFQTGGDPTLDHVLAAWGLTEAYGMSATQRFKGPAQRSTDALSRYFPPTTGWGEDARAAWTALALQSARDAELRLPAGVIERGLEYLEPALAAGVRPKAAAGWAVLRGGHDLAALRATAERAALDPPDSASPDLTRWYFETVAVARCDGNEGPLWKSRYRRVNDTVRALWNGEGILPSWGRSDSAIRQALMVLNVGVVYSWYPDPGPAERDKNLEDPAFTGR